MEKLITLVRLCLTATLMLLLISDKREEKMAIGRPTAQKLQVAFHEAGHVLIAAMLEDRYPGKYRLQTATIIPKGDSLGRVRWSRSRTENRAYYSADILIHWAGFAAVKIMRFSQNSGCGDDLKKAAADELAMLEISRNDSHIPPNGQTIDALDAFYLAETEKILENNKGRLILIAAELLRKKTLSGTEVRKIMKMRVPNPKCKPTLYRVGFPFCQIFPSAIYCYRFLSSP